MPGPSTNLTQRPDRFSLLLLEPGEIYFKDVAVTYCSDPDFQGGGSVRRANSAASQDRRVKIINGWLKICSKSLVFVPTEASDAAHPDSRPLVKLPLADCTDIRGQLCQGYVIRKNVNIKEGGGVSQEMTKGDWGRGDVWLIL